MADPFKMNKSPLVVAFWVAFIIYHVCVWVCRRLGPFIVLQMQNAWSLHGVTDKTIISRRIDEQKNPLCVIRLCNLNSHHWPMSRFELTNTSKCHFNVACCLNCHISIALKVVHDCK